MRTDEMLKVQDLYEENARLRAAAQTVVDEYPVAAGTTRPPSPKSAAESLGYGSIKALRLVLEQEAPRCSRCGESHSPRCE